MIKCFVKRKFGGPRSSVEMVKGYMLTCRNAERVNSQRMVGNPCLRVTEAVRRGR